MHLSITKAIIEWDNMYYLHLGQIALYYSLGHIVFFNSGGDTNAGVSGNVFGASERLGGCGKLPEARPAGVRGALSGRGRKAFRFKTIRTYKSRRSGGDFLAQHGPFDAW